MEFNEKLQELRKSRGMTQENLAEALFVSRAAVSKWESGRGYPSIESLKDISRLFSVTVDQLLSSDKLILLAEQENKTNMQNVCRLLRASIDISHILLILLPLYPKTIDGYIYSVNLWMYMETTTYNKVAYWVLFASLIAVGIARLVLYKLLCERADRPLNILSTCLSILTILCLVLAKEVYASVIAILFLVVKRELS